MRIVIVEDEASIRDGMEGILRKLSPDYELAGKAADGIAGLELIERERPDVIIMDIQMPDMDGLTMLARLREEGVDSKVVILSAYSDFTYAKKAMELNAANYLLKPVRVHELEKVLREAERELEKERFQSMVISPENMIRSAQLNVFEDRELNANLLLDKLRIDPTERMGIFLVWLGSFYDRFHETVNRILKETAEHARDFRAVVSRLPEESEFTLILYGMGETRDYQAWIEAQLLPMILTNTGSHAVCGFAHCSDIYSLGQQQKELRSILDYSLVYGGETLITQQLVHHQPLVPLRYSPELALRARQAVYKRSGRELAGAVGELMRQCREQPHEPSDIKDVCISFCWTVLNAVREYMSIDKYGLQVQKHLECIANAVSWEELEREFDSLKHSIDDLWEEHETKTEVTVSRLVMKARHLIEEHYNQGITMEEAARILAVSPEYLSRLYKKETGVSFTEEIRNCRVEKMKTLLIGTNLNLTQIASLTGFSDPKYMSRVFRDVVGMLPADYRKVQN